VVASVVWVVYRTVEQAQVSDQSVLHTQEVLTSLEAVLATVVMQVPAAAAPTIWAPTA
jgi:hypothetical protein